MCSGVLEKFCFTSSFYVKNTNINVLSCEHMTKICVYANFAYMQILHTCAKVFFTLRSHGF